MVIFGLLKMAFHSKIDLLGDKPHKITDDVPGHHLSDLPTEYPRPFMKVLQECSELFISYLVTFQQFKKERKILTSH